MTEHRLNNGLRLLILPRPGAPIVSFVVQYRIGSVNEEPGSTGIAHLLEHLLFKGTTTVGTSDYQAEKPLLEAMDLLQDSILLAEDSPEPDEALVSRLRDRIREMESQASNFVTSNEFDEILTRNGARNLNAITTMESTTYFVELPSNRTELWFVLEADRMSNPVFREFYTERDVVAEERRYRLENSPGGLLYEAHLGAAFQVHPYGAPVIGYMADIQRLTRPTVASYFRNYYGPNNAVVVIVGDLDPARIVDWAEEYLGPIPRGEDAPPVRAREPEQRGERRVTVEFDAEPILRVGWKVPPFHHEDGPAVSMLTSILTGGRSSRLYRRLVLEDRTASGVTSTVEPGRLYPGLFTVEAYPRSPHTVAELEAVIYEELDSLASRAPDESELQRVRNQLEASQVRRLRSNFGLALQMADSESLTGDWTSTFTSFRDLQAVTPQDIQAVVRKYFKPRFRTVATLSPTGETHGGRP